MDKATVDSLCEQSMQVRAGVVWCDRTLNALHTQWMYSPVLVDRLPAVREALAAASTLLTDLVLLAIEQEGERDATCGNGDNRE